MTMRLLTSTTAVVLAICASGSSAAIADAEKLRATLTGDAKGAAASNPQCKLFTQAEAGKYLGRTVKPGRNAAMGTGCQWVAAVGNGSVMVQVVRASDHSPASGAPGFRKLRDVGKDGFVVPQMGGFQAGAIVGDKAVEVMTDAKDESLAVALLKDAMTRVKH